MSLPCWIRDELSQERIRWFLILPCTTLSLIFSYLSVSRCSFLVLDYGESNTLFDPYVLGLFTVGVYDTALEDRNQRSGGEVYGCLPQHNDPRFRDGAFTIGRAFGILTVIIETMLWILLVWILLSMRPDCADRAWRWGIRGMVVLSLLCQLFTFAVFASRVCSSIELDSFGGRVPMKASCGPGSASIVAAFNVFILIAVLILAAIVSAPIHPYFIRWTDDDVAESPSFPNEFDDRSYDSQECKKEEVFEDDYDEEYIEHDENRDDKGANDTLRYTTTDDTLPLSNTI